MQNKLFPRVFVAIGSQRRLIYHILKAKAISCSDVINRDRFMLLDVYLVRRRFDDEGGGDDGFCRISIILAIAL